MFVALDNKNMILEGKDAVRFHELMEEANKFPKKRVNSPLKEILGKANPKRISYDRLLGEFIGTLEGICANEILSKELKDKLKLKREELKKMP